MHGHLNAKGTSFLTVLFVLNVRVSKTKNCGVAIDGAPQGFVNGLVNHSWNHAFFYEFPVMYKVLHLLFKC